MSLQPFRPEDIELFTVQTNPESHFTSGASGITGSAYVYPHASDRLKDFYVNWHATDTAPTNAFVAAADITDVLQQANQASPSSMTPLVRQYLSMVKTQPSSSRLNARQDVERFTPGSDLSLPMTMKLVTANRLIPEYSTRSTNYDFSFTNYNSLNFFSGSDVPTSSVLLYPCTASVGAANAFVTASYIPSGAFTFDLWINPRYTPGRAVEFVPGTILHYSGCYALSLITGSSIQPNGSKNNFRLMLQLSSAADTRPDTIDPNNPPAMVYVSDDSSSILQHNTWNHVSVFWGGSVFNSSTGSFVVNDVSAGNFVFTGSTIAPREQSGKVLPKILAVGNFYDGASTTDRDKWFSSTAQLRYGVPVSGLEFITSTDDTPTGFYAFRNPLQAEVLDLKLFDRVLRRDEIALLGSSGSCSGSIPGMLFQIPPAFTPNSPTRSVDSNGGWGGVLAHPFTNIDGSTRHPFNVDMSFDTGGHYINLENWTREFVLGNYPRLVQLTGSVIQGNTELATANQFLYATGSVRKASLTVLPCDNGLFVPDFAGLLSGSDIDQSMYVNDNGDLSYNIVTLRDMYSLDAIYDDVGPSSGSITLNVPVTQSIIESLSGLNNTSSFGTLNYQQTPTILQRTMDNGSLQVVLFDISNLFYGDRILPGHFSITDNNVSCSSGQLSMTLKDDGFGSLYRSDWSGSLAKRCSVGNVFYEHGIVMIKHPSLYHFGKNGFDVRFRGERNVYTVKYNMYANPLQLISSSNSSWAPDLQVDNNPNMNLDERYVYITDLYVHDENLNVIGKSRLSQPTLKRASDKLKFRVGIDW
jgi:hypothetical protein